MSWKTRKDLSAFGSRLRKLMGGRSLHEVATSFYDDGLIKVVSRSTNKERSLFDKRDSAIGSIEKRIREHINADGPECLQGEYVKAYCRYFNCSSDYLFGYTDVQTPNVEIRKICERTGLSEKAVKNFCDQTENQGGQSVVHRCWSRLMESDGFLNIPSDWMVTYDEACEVLRCDAAVKAIETVLKNEDPQSLHYNFLAIKEKPIQKSREAHYAAYYGMLHKLSQDVTTLLNVLIQEQIAENQVHEQALNDLTMQYQNELYAINGEKEKIIRPKDEEFHFNKHFMV